MSLLIELQDMTLLTSVDTKSRFQDVLFLQIPSVEQEILAVACEDGKTRLFTIPVAQIGDDVQLTSVAELSGHANR